MNRDKLEITKVNEADRAKILLNIQKHDEMAEKYDAIHIEIYNPIEQLRINDTLRKVVSLTGLGEKQPLVLDFGAGTGNLTRHFLYLGASVVAADVSNHSLCQLEHKMGASHCLQTVLLNGIDLSDISDNYFDVVATYSVLHHVPDYLAMIDEFVRVVKPGGIIYIDHEAAPIYWEENIVYQQYLEQLGGNFSRNHLFELGILEQTSPFIKRALKSIIRKIYPGFRQKPAASEAGDIHVVKHDHIEWDEINERLSPSCKVIEEKDYLVCRELAEQPPVWEKWHNRCVDMRYIIAKKVDNVDGEEKQ